MLTLSIKRFIFEGTWAQRPHYIRFLGDVDAEGKVSGSTTPSAYLDPGSKACEEGLTRLDSAIG